MTKHHVQYAIDGIAVIDRCGDVPIDLTLDGFADHEDPAICPNCGAGLWVTWGQWHLHERMPGAAEPAEPDDSVADWEPFCECGHPSKRHAYGMGRSYCRVEACECLRFVRRELPPEPDTREQA